MDGATIGPLMPAKRDVLLHLTRDELLTVVDRFDLASPDRHAKDGIIDAVVASKKANLPEIIAGYSRDCPFLLPRNAKAP